MPELPDFELPELDWDDPDERAKMLLGFSGAIGGGVIGYYALQSIRKGDLFWVEPESKEPESVGRGLANFVAGAIALVLFGTAIRDTFKEYGTKPVVLGSAAIGGTALLVSWLRR